MKSLKLKNFEVEFNYKKPLVLIAGINVLESEELALKVCEKFKTVCEKENLPFVFKASFDKANRSSINSYRGPGLEKGLKIFEKIKEQFHVPVITDYHEPHQADELKDVVDILQLPAFLSRQTDLVVAGAKTGLPLHVKKAQFLSPWEMENIQKKCIESGNDQLLFCERGSSFGYKNLIVDMLGMLEMKQQDLLVTFDVTHSLQIPGGQGSAAGGRRQFSLPFARSGVALGLAGLFLESHPDPENAKCDGPSALPFAEIDSFVKEIAALDRLVKGL